MTQTSLEPIFASEEDATVIKHLERILEAKTSPAKLVSAAGEEIVIPQSVYAVLRQVVELMASGRAALLLPLEHELTTKEAADLLNVSRPFLIRLLEQGAIPYRFVGSHRRIRLEDLMAYKEQRDKERRQSLRRLTEFSEEMGLYDDLE